MTLIERIKSEYDLNEPIVLSELHYSDKSSAAIRNGMKRLVDKGALRRYDDGIYYLPKESRLGTSTLSTNVVLTSKYIKSDEQVFGYYAGLKLLNEMGLTTQVPNTIEIVTNKAKTRKRTAEIGRWKVVLKKPSVPVTADNVSVLKLLELVNYNQFSDLSINAKKEIINKLGIDNENIWQLTSIASSLPASTCKKIIQSEVIYAATS